MPPAAPLSMPVSPTPPPSVSLRIGAMVLVDLVSLAVVMAAVAVSALAPADTPPAETGDRTAAHAASPATLDGPGQPRAATVPARPDAAVLARASAAVMPGTGPR